MENDVTAAELNSAFKEYVKYNTALFDALLQLLVENEIFSPVDLAEINRRQVANLARLDQLEAAAADVLKADPTVGAAELRKVFEEMSPKDYDDEED